LKQEQKEPTNSIKQKTQRKTRTGKLGNGGGDPERLMKNAHAHKNEMRKRKQGLMKVHLRMKGVRKRMCVRVQRGRKRD